MLGWREDLERLSHTVLPGGIVSRGAGPALIPLGLARNRLPRRFRNDLHQRQTGPAPSLDFKNGKGRASYP